MNILRVLLLLLITAIFSSSVLYADDARSNRYKDRIKMRELYSQLDLTAKQQEQMDEHRQNIRKYRQERINSRKKFRNRYLIDLVEFISKDGFDKQGFIDKKMENIKTRVENRATMVENRMKILTPKQRVLLVKLLKEKLATQ